MNNLKMGRATVPFLLLTVMHVRTFVFYPECFELINLLSCMPSAEEVTTEKYQIV